MRYYLDTEFLEGSQKKWFGRVAPPTIDLISIGIVAEDGREYYAISKDFNLKEAWNRYDLNYGSGDQRNLPPIKTYWIRDNVLKPIWKELAEIKDRGSLMTYKRLKYLLNKYGKTNKQIAEEIIKFVRTDKNTGIYFNSEPTFYGYYSDYDWVVFCWLFGKMIDLPNGFPMYCIDLQQESDRLYKLKKEEYVKDGGKNFINKMSNHPNYPKQTDEHNALSDARFNKQLHEFLNKI